MINKPTEKGQALVVVALAAIVLFGFASLAIDGSAAFSDRRHAQNAADTAAMAGALKYARSSGLWSAAQDIAIYSTAKTRTTSNCYDKNGTSHVMTVTITYVPERGCPRRALGKNLSTY